MFKSFIEQFLFFPNKDLKKNPSILSIDYENINLNYNNDTFHGWFIQGNYKNSITQSKCILFFHGNAGNISFRLNYIEKLYDLGFSLLFFDYPGFGLSTGVPDEDLCIKCGQEFYKYLTNNKNFSCRDIILYGESIGGSIASSVANIYNVKYLILQSTFTDIKEIIKLVTTFTIFSGAVGFETLENLKIRFKLNKLTKKMKTLIIHSPDDELIDVSHADKLSKYADKLLITSGSHSNITMDDDFIFNLLTFIKD
jgi:esterase/lipase